MKQEASIFNLSGETFFINFIPLVILLVECLIYLELYKPGLGSMMDIKLLPQNVVNYILKI